MKRNQKELQSKFKDESPVSQAIRELLEEGRIEVVGERDGEPLYGPTKENNDDK